MLRLLPRAFHVPKLAVLSFGGKTSSSKSLRYLSRSLSQAEKSARAAQQRAAARRARGDLEGVSGSHSSSPATSTQSASGSAPLNIATRKEDSRRFPSGSESIRAELVTQPAEAKNGELMLSPPALVVTREYEWGNIVFGFEQANRYTIRAAPGGEVVGYIAEEDSIGKSVVRNVLRTHRSFKATILDKNGETAFVIRRPFYVVSTNLFVDEPGPNGKNLGQVEMSWHLWRRRYSLFADNHQFAEIDTGFLGVDFNMIDEEGRRIASVNKDFTGFAREIFTDARQYVLRLDPSFSLSADGLVKDSSAVSAGDYVATNNKDARKLTLSQRAVILAAAISIDFDYFSLHSRGGIGPGGMFMPMPVPGGGEKTEGGDSPGGEVDGSTGNSGNGIPETGPTVDPTINSGTFPGAPEGVDDSSFQDGAPDGVSGSPQGDSQWATFEEPDYGFQSDPGSSENEPGGFWGSEDGSSSDVSDSGDGDGNPIIELIKSIFYGDD